MVASTPVPFADYEPDKGKASGASFEAKGVISQAKRYVPLLSPKAYKTGAITNDHIIGGFGCYSSGNAPYIFVGDRGRLYRLVGKAPIDISKSGGYAADPAWGWNFAQFGDNIIAASRSAAVAQRFLIGTDSAFDDLDNAPAGDVVFRIREHLWICNGRVANWSGFNNITQWEPDLETQAGTTTVGQDNGLIVAGIGGEQGAIFQERGIIRVTYTGATAPWILDEVEGGRGACGPRAVCRWGKGAFHAAEDGLYYWNGSEIQPVGQDKVSRTFASLLNYPYRSRVVTAIDAERKCWMVAFPTGASTTPDMQLIYSWADDRWTYDEIDLTHLFEMPREGVTLDDTQGIIDLFGTANVDELTGVSLDDPAWRESRRSWAGANLTREVVTFSGPTRPATIETGQFEPNPGGQTYVSEVKPLIDAAPGSVTAELYVRENRMDEAEILLDEAAMNEYGTCDIRGEARFLRARVNVAAGAEWTEATGILSDARASGGR